MQLEATSKQPGPTPAHDLSAGAIIDPAYSATRRWPPQDATQAWLYPRAEFECFLLSKLRRDVKALRLKVGYPGEFHEPGATAYFRIAAQPGTQVFQVVGAMSASLDGKSVDVTPGRGRDVAVKLAGSGVLVLKVSVKDATTAIPSIYSPLEGWEASSDGVHYSLATRDRPQFDMEAPSVDLPLQPLGGSRFDAGREVLATLEISSRAKPLLRVGESIAEMENQDPTHAEQATDLVQVASGRWDTPQPLAFRYVAVDSESPTAIACRAVFPPVQYRGAFHADPELDAIWMCAAYTARLCMHPFMLDGIKRDRLPWLGDLSISLMANAYAFADPLPVRRTLAAIGRAGIKEKHLNGIIDYTLWYFICHDQYQRYFADRPFLESQYPEIRDILADICRIADAAGGLLPDQDVWCFIDWCELERATTLQVLFHWALKSAARLADRMGDAETAGRCRRRAGALCRTLFDTAFDAEAGLFFAIPLKPESGMLRHPNFLAVLAGMTTPEQAAHIASQLAARDLAPVGTPYMAALECLALHRSGRSADAIAEIRRVWGGMLRHGATTFYEAYREGETEAQTLAFYGRPYGRSLCHAWSAAPAALLPIIAFGCEPAADGWAEYAIAGHSVLQEACATVCAGSETLLLSSTDGRIARLSQRNPAS